MEKFPSFAEMATRVTAEMAQELLGKTTIQNRHIRHDKVDGIAALMTKREWAENGESIILDRHNNVLDGQHRLLGVVKSGVATRFLVVRGIDPLTMPTIDTGNARTAADVLSMQNYKNYATLAASLGWLHRYETSQMLAGAVTKTGFTPSVCQAMARTRPLMEASVAFACGLPKAGRAAISTGPLSFCHYVMADKDSALATRFLTSLADGTDIARGSPLYLIRRMFVRTVSKGIRMDAVEAIAFAFKAWSATRAKETPRTITWRRFGAQAEDFPPLERGETTRGPAIRLMASPRIRLSAANYVLAALQSGPQPIAAIISGGQAPPFKLPESVIRSAIRTLNCVTVKGRGTRGKQVIALPKAQAAE